VAQVRRLLLAWIALMLGGPALAATPEEEATAAELERVRKKVANQVHLSAFDLIDEMVWRLSKDPVFADPTPVVLADVTVPVGLGTGLSALVENHLTDVLLENPTTNVQLVHCPECTAVVVHSGPEGTVVSRGIDNPEALERLGTQTGQHALFLDIEAEGTWLVLRARMTRLTPDRPIVWSQTLASSTSSASLLRSGDDLKSADDAREEYLDALKGRGPISVPLRIALRTYAPPDDPQRVPPPPFLWVQSGVELSATRARGWTASLIAGYSFIPDAYQGLLGQARFKRLLTGRSRSLTRPDLYGFIGGAAVTVWGPATASFQNEPISADDILQAQNGDNPRSIFGTFQVGLELRVGNRIGLSSYLEHMPSLRTSPNLGSYVRVLGVSYQSLGTEVTFWF
jgi:hypothetical protein